MDPFILKNINEATSIATELERQNYMFEHGLKEAPELRDIDAHNERVMRRGYRSRKHEFGRMFRRNVYACYLGLDITRNFYKNIYNYKKLPYKIRKGENLVAKMKKINLGTDFQ